MKGVWNDESADVVHSCFLELCLQKEGHRKGNQTLLGWESSWINQTLPQDYPSQLPF